MSGTIQACVHKSASSVCSLLPAETSVFLFLLLFFIIFLSSIISPRFIYPLYFSLLRFTHLFLSLEVSRVTPTLNCSELLTCSAASRRQETYLPLWLKTRTICQVFAVNVLGPLTFDEVYPP